MAATPKKIGKYKVVSQLATGGMGTIYKAEHPTLGSSVIIKCLTIKNHPAIEERFRREARIMMDLRNERIVQVYDHFKERSSYCIVMEYVEGIDLDHLIKAKRYLSNDMALLIISEVCKALKYAHERNVIHRDIKPANILISKSGDVKLTDFGVAATVDQDEDLTKTGMTLGTPAFMSPEQISDPRKVDQRADIYSTGVLLYVMLTGQKPFDSSFTPEVVTNVTRGRYILPREINPKIPSQIQRLIRKAMHHKIKKRYKDIDEILKQCSRFLSAYNDQKQINSDIRRYLEGKQPAFGKGSKRRWFGLKQAMVMAILLSLGAGGVSAYRNGLHYELLYPDEYGSLIVEAKIRKSGRALSERYLNYTLFSQDNKSWKEVEGGNFGFKHETLSTGKALDTIRYSKRYLPKGYYLIRLDLDNEQCQTQFYLASRSIQRILSSEKDGYRISMVMDKDFPALPLKFNCKVKNRMDQKDITGDTRISIYHDSRWVQWEDFEKEEALFKTFTSGKDYSFQFSGDGFYTEYANISVDPEQTVLNLEVTLNPLPGYLYIRSDVADLTLLLNALPYYLQGDKSPEYKRLPPVNLTGQKISLPAGNYSLTIKEGKPLMERISLFPPEILPLDSKTRNITIHQGETLNVHADINPVNAELRLEIR